MSERNVLLSVKNLDISFGGVHAVNDLSFDIYEGEILGLIGPNGSGKSTCVNLISGFYTPNKGRIMFRGENITKLTVPQRSFLGLGRTFQAPQSFAGLSVIESIYAIALLHNRSRKDAQNKTDEILNFTGLEKNAFTMCSQLPIEIRRWLDMARVLATNPKLIMLDECLAGLNPSEMDESIHLVQKINQTGVTILFIEHVMSAVVKLCTRVFVLNEGSYLAEGIPEEVMKNEKVISAYLGGGYVNAGRK